MKRILSREFQQDGTREPMPRRFDAIHRGGPCDPDNRKHLCDGKMRATGPLRQAVEQLGFPQRPGPPLGILFIVSAPTGQAQDMFRS